MWQRTRELRPRGRRIFPGALATALLMVINGLRRGKSKLRPTLDSRPGSCGGMRHRKSTAGRRFPGEVRERRRPAVGSPVRKEVTPTAPQASAYANSAFAFGLNIRTKS